MRVISGKAKGHKLRAVPGDSTRPIIDRVKENLFNILGEWVEGTKWLDLFAGTGQVGIEALSRGASMAIFVDNSRLAVQTVQENLRHTKLIQDSSVHLMDAFRFLELERYEPFDVVYVAPPQYQGTWIRILEWIDQNHTKVMAPGGQIIVQIDPMEFSDLSWNHIKVEDQRKYGRTLLCFYGLVEE